MQLRKVETLSHRQRKATPPLFALRLVGMVRQSLGVEAVSVLWVAIDSVYKTIPGCDCWDEKRDAMKYDGPGPVICHPPCGPWGKFRWRSRERLDDGIKAMDYVHRYGGVVEQPSGSRLFKLHGMGGHIEVVNQSDFGHLAEKKTLLYWVI